MTVCQNLEEALKSNYRLYLRTCKGKIFAIVDKYSVDDKAGNCVGVVCEITTMSNYYIRYGSNATEFLMELVKLDAEQLNNYGDSLFIFEIKDAEYEDDKIIDVMPKSFVGAVRDFYETNVYQVFDDQTTGYYTIMK